MYPVKASKLTVTSAFGPRTYTYQGRQISDYHKGIDLIGGSEIVAFDDGVVTANKEDVIIATKNSMSIHFSLSDVPFSSRTAIGVKAIKLDESDEVVSCIVSKDTVNYIGVAFEDGLGKKIEVSAFPIQGRAGKGVQLAKDKILAGAVGINNEDNLLISTRTKGICISATDIPMLGRQAAGNKLIIEGRNISVGKI